MSGPTVLLIYGLLIIFGGVMGLRAGSKVSLYAGGGSGLLLLVAWFVSRSHLELGLWIGVAISVLLSIVSGMRLAKTKKFMPSGMLLLINVAAFGLLVASVLG